MSADEPASLLRGVRFGSIDRHEDARGSFRELWRADVFDGLDPAAGGAAPGTTVRAVQANLSASGLGVLRGLHLHQRQLDHWVVAAGRAFVALVDIRPLLEGSGPHPLVETRILKADETVTIPIGVAHGFLALEPLELIYFVTERYDATDELGFAWDDPDAAVPWPVVAGSTGTGPILSPRDQANPSLAHLVATIRR
ncbi:MAG: dTDP-4-dehydrorhamnose 3,5-epimerase family protein [Chloroflexota bacterium]